MSAPKRPRSPSPSSSSNDIPDVVTDWNPIVRLKHVKVVNLDDDDESGIFLSVFNRG